MLVAGLYPNVPGVFHSPARARQLISFRDLLGIFPRNGTPTDIDLMVEASRVFLIGEFKKAGTEVPKGQRWAIERMIWKLGKGSIAFVAEHNTASHEIINAAECRLVEWFTSEMKDWHRICVPRVVPDICRYWVKGLPPDQVVEFRTPV